MYPGEVADDAVSPDGGGSDVSYVHQVTEDGHDAGLLDVVLLPGLNRGQERLQKGRDGSDRSDESNGSDTSYGSDGLVK